jgi:hypothetical protein
MNVRIIQRVSPEDVFFIMIYDGNPPQGLSEAWRGRLPVHLK